MMARLSFLFVLLALASCSGHDPPMAHGLLRRPLDPPPAIRRPVVLWRPPDAIAHLEKLLSDRPNGGELLEFLPAHVLSPGDRMATSEADVAAGSHVVTPRGAIASTLIGALELTRRGTAACDQREVFVSVRVRAVSGAAET
jgi:hypothetical protein